MQQSYQIYKGRAKAALQTYIDQQVTKGKIEELERVEKQLYIVNHYRKGEVLGMDNVNYFKDRIKELTGGKKNDDSE